MTGAARLRQMLANRAAALVATAVLSTVAAVLVTWPLAREMGTATLRDGEVLLTAWQLNWFHHALLTDPRRGSTRTSSSPTTAPRRSTTCCSLTPCITLPAAWAESPVLALNLALLGGIVLCGVCAYLLSRRAGRLAVGGQRSARTLFALAPFRFLHLGHLSIAAAWPVPLFFWALLRHLRQPSWARAALAACRRRRGRALVALPRRLRRSDRAAASCSSALRRGPGGRGRRGCRSSSRWRLRPRSAHAFLVPFADDARLLRRRGRAGRFAALRRRPHVARRRSPTSSARQARRRRHRSRRHTSIRASRSPARRRLGRSRRPSRVGSARLVAPRPASPL